jgi:hypothetical protein
MIDISEIVFVLTETFDNLTESKNFILNAMRELAALFPVVGCN